jgi:PAS domain S-box-containing protein
VSTDHVGLHKLLSETVRDYAIFVLDPEGRVLTWSPGAQALKGYTRDEIVSQHFSKFYREEAVQSGWPTRELELAEKEGRFTDKGWRVRKDGSTFWASVVITALRNLSYLLHPPLLDEKFLPSPRREGFPFPRLP